MSLPAPYDPIQSAFETAVREFRTDVKNDSIYQQILATKTIDDVYDATDKLQKEQSAKGHMRHLAKIDPFLRNLNDYASTIEVFLQAKPDFLALIWGPIKLLLQWTSNIKQSFDAIVNMARDVGSVLPEFGAMAQLFHDNPHIKDVLLLFFKDILDFYSIALKFFSMKRLTIAFESMWPRQRDKIKVVMENIERHTILLRNEVRLEHIQEEHKARIRALQHFEQAEKAHRRQEYHAIKTDVSPITYERDLDRLRGRVCKGTDAWLENDSVFQRWADAADSATTVLWLQGIPGAGKTFLSSLIIDRVNALGSTAYAFLSYNHSSTSSALSILQSLIFQLASSNDDLQEIVCQRNCDLLKSNIDATSDLLITLISFTEPVYVLVDGLDEIDAVERGRLLRKLLSIVGKCSNTKLLISSRIEHDISLLMRDHSVVRIDSNNHASVETFVTESTKAWFRESEFSPGTQIEIQKLLVPLAPTAKGMFLYAKVVLQNVFMLDDLEEIRGELRALPENLHDAYSRIVDRINNVESVLAREKARKLLGWVACAPIPMTIQEMEQALSIRKGDFEGNTIQSGSVNAIKLCGPILEIVDGYVQFVHFTVKEYLLSPKVPGHISYSEAILGLILCCTTYLQQKHHNIDQSNDQIVNNIVSGSYKLHNFALTIWFKLLKTYVKSVKADQLGDSFFSSVESFLNSRSTAGEIREKPNTSYEYLKELKAISPDLHKSLCRVADFHDFSSASEIRINDVTWVHRDPTSLSEMRSRLFTQFEKLLACQSDKHDKCHCQAIRKCYGEYPFKCAFLTCPSHRQGFKTATARKLHEKNHDQTWKCNVPDCGLSSGGFLSRKMRDEHWNLCHRDVEKSISRSPDDLGDRDLVSVLADLVKLDDLETVKNIKDLPNVSKILSQKLVLHKVADIFGSKMDRDCGREFPLIHYLICTAAAYSSSSMFCMLLGIGDQRMAHIWHGLNFAIKEQNTEVVEYLLEEFDASSIWDMKYHIGMTIGYTILTGDGMYFNAVLQKVEEITLPTSYGKHKNLPYDWHRMYNSIAQGPMVQEMLVTCWNHLVHAKLMDIPDLGRALSHNARSITPHTVNLAVALLTLGAPVDHQLATSSPTPLEYAARSSSAEGAELMKLLLLHGADPEAKSIKSVPSISDSEGAKGIKKWLGVTWDELVAQAKQHRTELEESKQKQDHDLQSSKFGFGTQDPDFDNLDFTELEATDVLEGFDFDKFLNDSIDQSQRIQDPNLQSSKFGLGTQDPDFDNLDFEELDSPNALEDFDYETMFNADGTFNS